MAVFPATLDLKPVARGPTMLANATAEAVLNADLSRLRRSPSADGTGETAPSASIAVVVFDGLVFTRLCLEGLIANTDHPSYELIVVDNGSQDGTREYLRDLSNRFSGIRVLRNDRNVGFAPAVNQALSQARGEILVLLNNDTIVPPGWLTRLVRHLSKRSVGLVGPVTNRIGNEAELDTRYRTYGGLLEFARRRGRDHDGRAFEIPEPTMFCVGFRRDLYDRIGPLDERFELGLFEDSDYAMRCHRAGYRTICAEDVFVHHFGGTSFGQLFPNGGHMRLFEANRRRFERKWGEPWRPHRRRENHRYTRLCRRIREAVGEALPSGATVAVVSRGDEGLLRFGTQRGWHFPRADDGAYAGVYPADSSEAIAHLEELRAKGADFLLVPTTGFWWLDHYDGFRRHLETNYRVSLRRDDACIAYELRAAPKTALHPAGRV